MHRAIIIGATSGIGREVARALVYKGVVVGIAGRCVIIFDWRFKLIVLLWRLIPRCLWERLTIVKN